MKSLKHLTILSLSAFFLMVLLVGCSGEDLTAPDAAGPGSLAAKAASNPVEDQMDMNGSNQMVPFRGRYDTVVGPPNDEGEFSIWGEGQATHLGRNTWYSLSSIDAEGNQTGSTAAVAANGDEFHYSYEGGSTPPDATGALTFWGEWVCTGGTGRFEGATGGGTYEGTANVFVGVGQINLVGEISRPH